jgi:SAM-dependent methyltransferase
MIETIADELDIEPDETTLRTIGELEEQHEWCYELDVINGEPLYDPLGILTELFGTYEKRQKNWDEVVVPQNQLELMLNRYAPRHRFGIPKNPRTLELGCFNGEVARGLVNYFCPDYPLPKENFYVGIDPDYKNIEKARKNHWIMDNDLNKDVPNPNYRFESCDAREIGKLDIGKFDVIAAFHPEIIQNIWIDSKNLGVGKEVWREIIQEAEKVHNPGGILVSTFYFPEEMQDFREILGDAYQVRVAAKNQFPHEVDEQFQRHKYILVAEKKA